jgi:cellulose synthase/poly-beta-1,6-N-acetylglucosamine synthase-like glycosyltransferase
MENTNTISKIQYEQNNPIIQSQQLLQAAQQILQTVITKTDQDTQSELSINYSPLIFFLITGIFLLFLTICFNPTKISTLLYNLCVINLIALCIYLCLIYKYSGMAWACLLISASLGIYGVYKEFVQWSKSNNTITQNIGSTVESVIHMESFL